MTGHQTNPHSLRTSVILALCSCSLVLFPGRAHATDKPNVVFILADDLGWSDTTLYGTTKLYRTPNIERLAERGMTFTRAYSSSPLCSPTRASILTGLSPARHGITAPNCHLPQVILKATEGTAAPPASKSIGPVTVTRLQPEYDTLAEMFQDNGYATGHFGKWHLGAEPYSPRQHGFDVDVPHWPGPGPAGSYVAPWKFRDFDHDPDIPDEHLEDRMAKEAVAFIEQRRNKPFFLNYWMFSVHAPFDAKKNLIDKYRGVVDLSDPQRCPTYAAMIESMDDAVGTLLDTLDRLGIAEKTIVVFASDNGGNMYNDVEGETPTSNAPLRGGKASMYEGGVRGPAIIVSPGRVKAGSSSDQIIQSSDFYPTLLELLDVDSRPGQSFDGISIVPALNGEKLKREAIFTYFPHSPKVPEWLPPSVSVHHGDWKLIRIFHGGNDGDHRWQLFNLADDIGEQHDLAAAQPARVQQLDAMIEDFLNDTQTVRPIRNPAFDPSAYHPELEGRQASRKPAPKPSASGKPSREQPVAGWQAENHCELSLHDGKLFIKATGGDPHLSYTFDKPLPKGGLVLKIRMSSTVGGRAQLFWRESGVQPAYFRARSVPFEVDDDGALHDYEIRFAPGRDLIGLRLDPSTEAGEIHISSIVLQNADNKTLHRWSF